jgi:hypothetical protein
MFALFGNFFSLFCDQPSAGHRWRPQLKSRGYDKELPDQDRNQVEDPKLMHLVHHKSQIITQSTEPNTPSWETRL